MKSELRRTELVLRREVRLFDEVTFARLCRARDYLGDCHCDRVTLENAAQKACLSRFHFNRLFGRVAQT
jgi:AraC-like DNA-binding protein